MAPGIGHIAVGHIAAAVAAYPALRTQSRAEIFRFTLSPQILSETALLDSPFASPGRYVGEIFRRLRRLCPHAHTYLALNPAREVPPGAVARLAQDVAERRIAAPGCVWSDAHGRPIAYALAAHSVDVIPVVHLGLLTAHAARTDVRFLRASAGGCELRQLPLHLREYFRRDAGMPYGNGFRIPRVPESLDEPALVAAQVLETASSDVLRERILHETERVAVLGYHAGDVLFLCQALSLEQSPFRTVGVLENYADIVAQLRPDLRCLTVHADAVPQRAGTDVYCELVLLREYVRSWERERNSQRTPARFYHFLRTFRSLGSSRHHLREALAFSVGGEGSALRPVNAPPVRSIPATDSVLVHLESGWSLKEYPQEFRAELLQLLSASGFRPTLLGRPEPSCPTIPAVPYTNLAALCGLLDEARAVIGTDSFPAHLASQRGVPTVQLFGPTRPANARSPESLRYRFLHHPMPCVPCDARKICALDGGQSCHAHARPAEVLAALQSLTGPRP